MYFPIPLESFSEYTSGHLPVLLADGCGAPVASWLGDGVRTPVWSLLTLSV